MMGSLGEFGETRGFPAMRALRSRWLSGREYFKLPLTSRVNSSSMMRSHRSEPPAVSLPGSFSRQPAVEADRPLWKNEPSKESGTSKSKMWPSRMLGAVSFLGGLSDASDATNVPSP